MFKETYTFTVKKAERSFDVPFSTYSDEVQASILEAGLSRILNDLVAGAKTQAESEANVQKKLDAWANGIVRTVATREGDPVRKRALEIASARIRDNANFKAWLVASGIKLSDKVAVAKLAELAKAAINKNEGDNAIMAQAKIDVAASKDLDIEVDVEV